MIGWEVVVSLWIVAQAAKEQTAPGATPAAQTAEGIEAPLSEAAVDPMAYTYNPFGKRDPFRPFLLDKVEKRESSDPLLNYDLAKFSLTGVLWGVSNPKAIVRDGDGRGHIISRGTKIGRNRGSVIRILKDEVIVAEEFRDPLGKLIVSEYSMKLSPETGRKK